jgi:peptide methionine sulfoxide reductase MsrB
MSYPDENEPLSAFDIDAADLQGQYAPKWGIVTDTMPDLSLYESLEPMSCLGFSLRLLSRTRIEQEASLFLEELPKRVLLEGATDPPQRKLTNNSHDSKGPAGQSDVEFGVFCCAIGGLPLFASLDLMPMSASSGWLSFSRPVANDHIVLVEPNSKSVDQKI